MAGLIDLLSTRLIDLSGGTRTERAADPEHLEGIEGPRGALVEAVLAGVEDDALVNRYLAGMHLRGEELSPHVEAAVTGAELFPLLAFAAPGAAGGTEILDLVAQAFPSPLMQRVPAAESPDATPRTPPGCDPSAPLLADVVRTSGTGGQRQALVRVYAGTLGGSVVRCRRERSGAVTVAPLDVAGLPMLRAGDLAAVHLRGVRTGDTLTAVDSPLLLAPPLLPDPGWPAELVPEDDAEAPVLAAALARMAEDDPTLRLDTAAGALTLWCLGQAQLQVVLDRLAEAGVHVKARLRRPALRESVVTAARRAAPHAASCEVQVEPLTEGAEPELVLPAELPGVSAVVRQRLREGLTTTYPAGGLRVTLTTAPGATDDAALADAAVAALLRAVAAAGARLLEPVQQVEVVTADEYLEVVRRDLARRRGRAVTVEAESTGRSRVRAEVPEMELDTYAVDLSALTHGSAHARRKYVRHAPMPASLAARLRDVGQPAQALT